MKELILILTVCVGIIHILYSVRIMHIMLDPTLEDIENSGLKCSIITIIFSGCVLLLNFL